MGLWRRLLVPLAVACGAAPVGCSLGLDFSPSVLLPPLDAGPNAARADVPAFDAPPSDAGKDRPATDAGAHDAGAVSLVGVDVGARDAGAPDADPCGGRGNGGQPCCAGDHCHDGYVCLRGPASAGACLRCGGNREPCCPGDFCRDPRECLDGTCQ